MLRIRFKRGTEAQNDSYTGALGSLSIDSDTNVVRIHDGTTVGGFKLGLDAEFSDLLERVENLGIDDVDSLSTALSLKAAYDQIGVDDGIAGLNSSGLIPTEQLPSYVEDIVDVEDLESLPAEGESGKLYVIKSTNELYRWSASGQRWARITSEVDSSNDLSEGEVNLFLTDQRVREAISVQGDLSYDPATGLITLNASVNSVNGQVGEATVGQADVGLSEVQDFTVATAQEAAEAQTDTRFTVPARIRTFAESMGFVDTDRGWTAEPVSLPTLELQGIWTQLADGPGGRHSHSAVALDGKMYVYGGVNVGILNDLWVYDPAIGTWSQLTNGPSARNRHSAVALNGKMYVYGGYDGSRLNELWVYDPATDVWSQLSSGPIVWGHSAVVLDGKMYVYGGSNRVNTAFMNLWVYDPVTDTWSQLSSGASGRYIHSAVALNGKMYVYGGYGTSSNRFNDLWTYDPVTDNWDQLTGGPGARNSHSSVTLNGKMYVYGGTASSGQLNHLWTYDPVTDNWDQLTDGPSARQDHSAVALNGKMYVYGGSDGSDFNELWVVE